MMQDAIHMAQTQLGSSEAKIVDMQHQIDNLGELGGQCAYLNDRYNEILNSTTWRVTQKVMTPYRKFANLRKSK